MKKTICVITAVLMLLVFSACGDKNDQTNTSPTDVSPSDIEIPEATPTPDPQPVSELSICGIPIVSGWQLTGIGYQGVKYEEGVLTLDDVAIVADYGSTNAIYFVGELEIVITGKNTITASNGVTAIEGAAAEDGSTSNLTISGDGSLTVTNDEASGMNCSGTISVNGGALDITGADAAVDGGAESLILGEGIAVTEDTGTHIIVGNAE